MRHVACAVVALLVLGSAQAKELRPAPHSGAKQDARYKEILFELYTKDYFSALVKLQVASGRGELALSPRDIDQLRGGLELSYGMHDEARERLRPTSNAATTAAAKNIGWYYTAKAAYRARDLQATWAAASEVRSGLPTDLAAEVAYWKVDYLLAIGRYQDAAAQFRQIPKGTPWRDYAMFNLGVAQLRTGQTKEGLNNIVTVGESNSREPELMALADKANLTVGYFYLRERKSAPAIEALTRVRLTGPFSNKALLGLGWANSFERRYAQALVPWVELRQRDSTDVTVQETLLATPYAYAQVGAPGQATRFYEDALVRYAAVQAQIEKAVGEAEQGALFAALFEAAPFDDVTLSRRIDRQGPESRIALVSELFGREDFQASFRAYRDLLSLKRNLDGWVVRTGLLLSLPNPAAGEQWPAKRSARGADFATQLRQLKERFNRAVSNRDYLPFADAKEVERYERIVELEHYVADLPDGVERAQLAQRLRVQKGLLQWGWEGTFNTRARQTGAQLGELLARAPGKTGAGGAPTSIGAAQVSTDTEKLERVFAARARAQALSDRCSVLLRAYEKLIQEETLAELDRKRRLVSAYLSQARYGVAQLYDEANSKPASKK